MQTLKIDQIPTTYIPDEVAQFEPNEVTECDHCHRSLKEECFEFNQDDVHIRHICTDCYQDRDLSICHFDLSFYPKHELVQLAPDIYIHGSHADIISTYHDIGDKTKYLDMIGVTPDPFRCFRLTLTANPNPDLVQGK